jgi:hypothetical protein
MRADDGECPDGFTAEVVAQTADGRLMLLSVSFSVTELDSDDPRRFGDGFVLGRPCPCLVHAHALLAGVIAENGLEHLA